MSIESETFSNYSIKQDRLLDYGFQPEGDRLIFRDEEITLSEIRVKQPIASTVLTRPNGERIVKINNDTMNNIDLLAWKLERNGVSVGSYLPKL